jgi:hypothetical protein
VDHRIREILPFINHVRVCGKCATKFNIQDRLEAALPHPPTMEQITNLMPVVALMEPTIARLAEEFPG